MAEDERSIRQESERDLPRSSSQALKRYPPLVAMVMALVIVVAILPSALNLPQANPSTVLEYAPVPPEDQQAPPSTEGAISSLGLGSSSSLTTGRADAPSTGRGASGEKKSDLPGVKKCVGKPPRQTEDPNAPPCVGYYDGDNGGATWQGVTGDEVTVLVYLSTYISTSGEQSPTGGRYCDIDMAPKSDPDCVDPNTGEELSYVRATRALSRYFNERFQTYKRRIHFHIFWTGASSPSGRRADAADNWEKLRPFAVIDQAFFGGYNANYAEAMVKRRTMVFGAFSFLANNYYRKNAPYIWGFWPDVEHAVDMYVSYVCQKVAPYPTAHAGDDKQNVKLNGKPRKYAFLSTTDDNFEGLEYFAQLAKPAIKKCLPPDSIGPDLTYSRNQYSVDTHPDAHNEARTNIASMRADGVTTVLWLSGYETAHSFAAFDAKFFPEWVVAGDGQQDAINLARDQQQEVWRHAWVVSNYVKEGRAEDSPARQAYREAEPQGNTTDEFRAAVLYRHFFTLFKGIQAAGPQLNPDTVDQGNHAIPRQASTDPRTAACFYDPNDFTCVKDAHEAWWDPDAPDPENDPEELGCWRMVRGGQRYLAGMWEGGDIVFANREDPCNSVTSQGFINPYGPLG